MKRKIWILLMFNTGGFLMFGKEYDRWVHRRKKVEKICSQLEEIDPRNPNVEGVKMLLYFCEGFPSVPSTR